ncbi:T9SS C-terminal target domain-containing protein [Hymenobacter rubripertinctus]|uniref:T9SS C-terminal target domain-containing protein n=2 Tax=Hymenobacter rubripertinctus TaxID=2029981 RepID=A0A418QS31_9BACT|nr:T9SS C-terminal target domain-containing protein [Hymenobacter rubripertinctus]
MGRTVQVPGCQGYYFTVYPNPAQEEVTVASQSAAARLTEARTTVASDFDVTLYNGQGKALRQGRSQNGQLRLNLRGLRPGLYQIRARQGNKWENHQLQITQ